MNIYHRIILLLTVIALAQANAGEVIYFLVAEFETKEVRNNDSYVLPLSSQEDIAHARFLISRGRTGYMGGDRTLVGAKVAGGKDGINRNYLDPRFPEWSWHVAESGFADITAEIIDGSPTRLENGFADWPSDRDGYRLIGFWTYTVVRELGPVPLYLSIVPERQGVEFFWSGPGTNYVYALQGKDGLSSTNWFPAPGVDWPLKTNHWTLPLTNAAARFFRVQAQQSDQ